MCTVYVHTYIDIVLPLASYSEDLMAFDQCQVPPPPSSLPGGTSEVVGWETWQASLASHPVLDS